MVELRKQLLLPLVDLLVPLSENSSPGGFPLGIHRTLGRHGVSNLATALFAQKMARDNLL